MRVAKLTSRRDEYVFGVRSNQTETSNEVEASCALIVKGRVTEYHAGFDGLIVAARMALLGLIAARL